MGARSALGAKGELTSLPSPRGLAQGAISRAVVLDKLPQPIPEENLQTLISAIKSTLSDRFASRGI
jgi:hypothetical protein